MTSPEFTFRFFFDAETRSCLWSADDTTRVRFGYPVALEDLSISQELADQVHALTVEFDSSIDWDNPAGPSPWSPEEALAFESKADVLLERLRKELGPQAVIIAEHRFVRA